METIIKGGEGVDFASGHDTFIKGGQIIGETVTGRVGGDLTIISQQDSARESRTQSSQSFGFSIPVYGMGGEASLNFSSQKQNAHSNYHSVTDQSGVFAGAGGFDIIVTGDTNLVGALIDSAAEASKNQLTTASLTVSDLHNSSDYSAKTSGFGFDASMSIGIDKGRFITDAGTTFGPGKGGLIPSLPMKEKGSQSSETRAAVAPGNITITDEARQQSLTGQSAADYLAALNRDTAGASQALVNNNPNLQNLLDKQAEIADAAGQAGQAVAKSIGDIADALTREYNKAKELEPYALKILDDPNASAEDRARAEMVLAYLNDPKIKADYENWSDGGLYKVLLHAAGAAIVAQIANGEGGNAALGTAASELASKQLQELAANITGHSQDSAALNGLLTNIITNVLSGAVGGLAGDESGATSAATVDRHNRMMHPIEKKWIEVHAQEYADLYCNGDVEMAKAILSQQLMKEISFTYSLILSSENDEVASKFLHDGLKGIVLPVDDNWKNTQPIFTAGLSEFLDDGLYLNKLGQEDLEFYQKYIMTGITRSMEDGFIEKYGEPAYNFLKDNYMEILKNAPGIAKSINDSLEQSLNDELVQLDTYGPFRFIDYGSAIWDSVEGAGQRYENATSIEFLRKYDQFTGGDDVYASYYYSLTSALQVMTMLQGSALTGKVGAKAGAGEMLEKSFEKLSTGGGELLEKLIEKLSTSGNKKGFILIEFGENAISKKTFKHIVNEHMPSKYAQSLVHQDRGIVEQVLKDKTFFNPAWSEDKIKEVTNGAVQDALSKKVLNGNHIFTFEGEKITVNMLNGVPRTSFGSHKFTYDDLLKLK